MADQRRKPQPGRSKAKPRPSEGFKPIKQVGVAYSIGAPLMVMGFFIVLIGFSIGRDTALLALGGGLLLAGMIAAASGKVI